MYGSHSLQKRHNSIALQLAGHSDGVDGTRTRRWKVNVASFW